MILGTLSMQHPRFPAPYLSLIPTLKKETFNPYHPFNLPPPATGIPIGEGAKSKGTLHQKRTLITKKDELEDLCDPKEAIRIIDPQSSDDVKETGIPMDLQVHREQATTHAGASVYLCKHEKCATTAYFAQNLASLYSHVRRKHLGIVLACPYCPNKVYWNSHGWKDHMTSYHHNVPHYSHTLVDEA